VSDGELEQTWDGHGVGVYAVAFAPDGKRLATASYDGAIGLFELGQEQGRFHSAHEGKVASVAFSPDGQRLVSTGEDGKTRLWDASVWPPTLVRDFPPARDESYWATFSPDGNTIASVGRDQLVRVMSVHDGHLQQTLTGHESTVYRAAFSPDSGQVATVSADATVRLWDLTTGSELFTLRLPTNSGYPTPLWDFDFRCTGPDCWIAVPLTRGKLVLYRLKGVYGD